jgi:aspartate/methionine/tyrosine aminotransferase
MRAGDTHARVNQELITPKEPKGVNLCAAMSQLANRGSDMRKILYTSAHALEETDVGYDLGRSTSNNLCLDEVLDDALVAALRQRSLGYGTTPGDDPLRLAIANNVGLHADQVLTTNGAIGALHLAIFCMCDHGDEVVTVTPGFPATFDLIQALGAVMKPLTLGFDDGYGIDAERLVPLLNERTKLVLLISPHNPSGVSTSPEVLASILDIMAARSPEAYLLLDETFREASYGVRPAMPSGATLSERVLTVSSLSKAHGAPGLRLGWITCTAPELLAHLTVGKGKTAISCSILDEWLGAHILEGAGEILSDRNARLGVALGATEDWVARNAELVEWVRPDAGGMCCVRLKHAPYDDAAVEAFYRLAAQRQINMAAGDRFGDQRRVFRLGFGALPFAKFQRALEALEDTCSSVLSGGCESR